jgi:hypothetical protein
MSTGVHIASTLEYNRSFFIKIKKSLETITLCLENSDLAILQLFQDNPSISVSKALELLHSTGISLSKSSLKRRLVKNTVTYDITSKAWLFSSIINDKNMTNPLKKNRKTIFLKKNESKELKEELTELKLELKSLKESVFFKIKEFEGFHTQKSYMLDSKEALTAKLHLLHTKLKRREKSEKTESVVLSVRVPLSIYEDFRSFCLTFDLKSGMALSSVLAYFFEIVNQEQK